MVSAFDHILAVVEYAFRDVLAYAQACQLSPPCATQIVRSDYVDPDLLKAGKRPGDSARDELRIDADRSAEPSADRCRPPRDPDSWSAAARACARLTEGKARGKSDCS